jgi:cyclophilin family peptidyl-prolyl cis-trans isomerase
MNPGEHPMTFALRPVLAASAAALLLAACGGGGGDSGAPPPTVSAATASDVRYSQTLTVTINGSNLDQALNVSSTGCRNMARSTTAPFVSSATTAYYRCQASAVGAQEVLVRAPDNTLLRTVPFTVAVPQVTMALSNGAGVAGNIVITLNATEAPITVDNFLAYVNAGFYDNTIFHRHAPNFVLQGGGYEAPVNVTGQHPVLKTPTRPNIQLEDLTGLSNVRWTVAMARQGDATTLPNTANSQFFINLADNLSLNGTQTTFGYAVFGTITAGTDVVTAAQAAPCSIWPTFFGNGTNCIPVPNIVITTATQTR